MSEEAGASKQGSSTAKKATAKKATAKKATAKKATAKKATAKKATASKATATKTSPRERAAAATSVLRSPSKKRVAEGGGAAKQRGARQPSSKWFSAKTAPVSKFFQEATERARKIIDDPEKLQQVARDSAASGAVRSGPLSGMLEEFRALVRLVNAYARGHYREISIDSLIFVVAGLLYVVMPIDLIPDAFAGVGFLDDAAVVAWVLKSVREELDAFKAWELGGESDVATPA